MKKLFIVILAALGISAGACAQSHYKDVDVNGFEQIIKSDSVQLVDVRRADEFAEGHIPGAIHIDVLTPSFLSVALTKLDKHRPCAVYCRSGKRSAMAAALLAKEGFTVTNLSGGILAWTEAKKKIVKD